LFLVEVDILWFLSKSLKNNLWFMFVWRRGSSDWESTRLNNSHC
jgi:hypothetical protein